MVFQTLKMQDKCLDNVNGTIIFLLKAKVRTKADQREFGKIGGGGKKTFTGCKIIK